MCYCCTKTRVSFEGAQTRTFILELFLSFYRTRKTLLRVKKYPYEGEKNHNILQQRLNGFPLRGLYISWLGQVCAASVYVCVCVCCAVFAPEVVCVCLHGCVKEKFRRHPSPSGFCITVVESHYPSWALWEFHQCVTSHLFTRLCGLHRVEQSRASPADTHRWPCNILRPVCVKTVQGIKLSKLQFSHFSLFCLSCPQLSDIYSVL